MSLSFPNQHLMRWVIVSGKVDRETFSHAVAQAARLIQLLYAGQVGRMFPTLAEDSVRYSVSEDLHCGRQGKRCSHVAHFLNRASSEEPFELTAELRGAFIADTSRGSRRG